MAIHPLLLLLVLSAACSAELTLVDGRVIEGEVISRDAETVVVRSVSGSLSAVQRFPADQVLSIRLEPSARRQQLDALGERQRLLADGGTAAEWWELAQAYRSLGETIFARRCAQAVLHRDREQVEAARLLGLVRSHGIWMRSDEAAVADGKVFHEGRWLTWTQRERLLAERERQLANQRREAVAALEARRSAHVPDYRWPVTQDLDRDPWLLPPQTARNGGFLVDGVWTPYPLRAVYWPARPVLVVPVRQQPQVRLQASGQRGSTTWAVDWSW